MGNPYHAWPAEKARERERLMIEASELIAAGRFNEAEAVMRERDGSPEAAVMLAKVYRECLRTAVATGTPRSVIDLMFERAADSARRAWDGAHTPIDVERFEEGRCEDEATLRRIRANSGFWRP